MTRASAEWTAGPWEVDDVQPSRINCAERGELIVDTLYATEKTAAEHVANARLIAAAPELYDALSKAYSVLAAAHNRIHTLPRTTDTDLAKRIGLMRAEIEKLSAKATGEQP